MRAQYTRGRKDGRLRQVQHIAVDGTLKQTSIPGTDCYMMRQLCDDGIWRSRPINRNRVETIEEDRYGHPDIAALGRTAGA